MKRDLTLLAGAMIACVPAAGVSANGGNTQEQGSAGAATATNRNSAASALASIALLHQADISATLSRNPRALASLWTTDAVRMQPGGPPEIGSRAIYIEDSTQHERSPRTQVVRYDPVIRDVQIVGDWAIEWGHFEGAYKQFPGDSLHAIRGNLLRVLRRQPGGSWRFARVMWNSAE